MSQRSESTIVSCARSAIQGFAHNTTPQTPECTFHTFTRLKIDTRFTNASPAPRLRKLKGEDGNNLIEYALVFMFFMSMVLGIVDFSRALYTYHFLSNAAREATRWAAVNGATCGPQTAFNPAGDNSCNGIGGMNNGTASESDIQNYVARITPPGVDSKKLTTKASWSGTGPICEEDNRSPGCTVEVKVSYDFIFVVPFIRSAPLTLSSSSEMIIVH
jgi:Flp pilus assembly protein TadG